MELILVSQRNGGNGTIRLGRALIIAMVVLLLAGVFGVGYLGFQMGAQATDYRPELSRALVREAVRQQSVAVDDAIVDAQGNVDALALRLGSLQAQLIRLDALGSRLVDMADLDPAEFDFETGPGIGGATPSDGFETTVPDFVTELSELSSQLNDRAPKLAALEELLLKEQLQASVHPEGSPVESGWISSRFGYRTDPLTGKRNFHAGVDFAGPSGSKVVAVAAGVVVTAKYKKALGNTVEINHGNGYTTRYAHNKVNLVKAGDTVKKGQAIALLGSSGRSTGPHVHFEVLIDGKSVNPAKYVEAAQ